MTMHSNGVLNTKNCMANSHWVCSLLDWCSLKLQGEVLWTIDWVVNVFFKRFIQLGLGPKYWMDWLLQKRSEIQCCKEINLGFQSPSTWPYSPTFSNMSDWNSLLMVSSFAPSEAAILINFLLLHIQQKIWTPNHPLYAARICLIQI